MNVFLINYYSQKNMSAAQPTYFFYRTDRGSRNLGQCVCLWFRQQQRGEGWEHHQAHNTSYHQVCCALPRVVHTDVVGEEGGRERVSLREHTG